MTHYIVTFENITYESNTYYTSFNQGPLMIYGLSIFCHLCRHWTSILSLEHLAANNLSWLIASIYNIRNNINFHQAECTQRKLCNTLKWWANLKATTKTIIIPVQTNITCIEKTFNKLTMQNPVGFILFFIPLTRPFCTKGKMIMYRNVLQCFLKVLTLSELLLTIKHKQRP